MKKNNADFIDNRNGNTMVSALHQLIGAERTDIDVVADNVSQFNEMRIATAYFNSSGFGRIANALKGISSIKLLLGTHPIIDNEVWRKRIGETDAHFVKRCLDERLKKQEAALRAERDQIPFERSASKAVRQLVDALQAGNMEVRRYEQSFLHAKAYILTSTTQKEGDNGAIIAGSSNLTAAGLSSNLELNLGKFDPNTVSKATNWFDDLWAQATPFDLADFFREIFEYKTPFEIFLRVLWELYGDEIALEAEQDKGLPLTSFQKHGVVRALRLIQDTGGVIIADEVGLGKTFIAGEILSHYQDRRQRALLVCPAALRDSSWKGFINDFELYLEVVSFEELARDKQLWDEVRRPNAKGNHLARNIDEYQLIIIDEAHNYRNPDSPTRADAMRTLLYGKRKDVLMLTATPVNNSLWDLYNLIRFFIKQDSFLASKGIISIKERFDLAMRTNPHSLSPDVLYPIVDATTVKRTRQFIKRHYPNDQVKINGEMQTIVFPEPQAITVRYKLDDLMPGLFDLIEMFFDPEHPECVKFSRYKVETYLLDPDPDSERIANAVTGLLLSGLLKRFESSTGAFRVSIKRLIEQHENFLRALNDGYVVTTQFLKESASTDDEDFDELLTNSLDVDNADLYDRDKLYDDVAQDLEKLQEIYSSVEKITKSNDPKLKALVAELEKIAEDAAEQAASRIDEINKRKVIIFSFFADTANWIQNYLADEIFSNPKLSPYKGRLAMVVGSSHTESKEKSTLVAKFAPDTAGNANYSNEIDILVSTDVLAEGVNLQQARHIINYDMPWNPMRLVQRHGRIDRIGSQHSKVYMRTIFPTDRLDALLRLEERISRKIAMAAASVGIVSPISGVVASNRDFTETKEEIRKLLDEDPSLYERGGTEASTQSGEEYRQTLRKAIETQYHQIMKMPWKAGSIMRNGIEQGMFFCAKIGERTYLRFVHANDDWTAKHVSLSEDEGGDAKAYAPQIEHEIGRCLRLIECSEEEETILDENIQDAAYDLWLCARRSIHEHWSFETDPANLQPRVRPLNRKVADFIRNHAPLDTEHSNIDKALDIVESPWSARDEGRLRKWFSENMDTREKSKYLVMKIIKSGLEPFIAPDPLPPISEEDIKLLVWMGITK